MESLRIVLMGKNFELRLVSLAVRARELADEVVIFDLGSDDDTLKMAKKVDIQNEHDNNYKKMSDTYETFAFKAACRLVLEGSDQPSGYTEPILHEMRLREKNT